MKTTKCFILIAFLLTACFGLTSCKKDNNNPLDQGGKSFTMKVDGVPWSAQITTLFTEQHDEGQPGGGYYAVMLNGTLTVNEEHAESLALYVSIPASKFQNPKGKYDIKGNENGEAWAVFSTAADIRNATTYSSLDINSGPGKTVGTLEITGFEVGDQSVLGQPTGKVGYKKLSGKFQLDLYPVDGASAKLNVTEGKFNLSNGLGFDFK